MTGSIQTVVLESAVMMVFVIAAVAGFKGSAWIIVGALAGHGGQDAFHGHIVENAGVPAWWPVWCLACDVGAAAVLGWFLMRGDLPSTATSMSSDPDPLRRAVEKQHNLTSHSEGIP